MSVILQRDLTVLRDVHARWSVKVADALSTEHAIDDGANKGLKGTKGTKGTKGKGMNSRSGRGGAFVDAPLVKTTRASPPLRVTWEGLGRLLDAAGLLRIISEHELRMAFLHSQPRRVGGPQRHIGLHTFVEVLARIAHALHVTRGQADAAAWEDDLAMFLEAATTV